jgi:hypothetical protein
MYAVPARLSTARGTPARLRQGRALHESCAWMNSVMRGAMFSRQRRPEKMP